MATNTRKSDLPLMLSPRFLQQLRDAGGAAVANLLVRATRSQEDAEKARLTHAAYERSWERLHCGSWKDVSSVWRQAFGIASVMQAHCLFRRQQFAECLEMLDMVRLGEYIYTLSPNSFLLGMEMPEIFKCLMMAGPLAPRETHTFLEDVERELLNLRSKPRLSDELLLHLGDEEVEEMNLSFPVQRLEMPTLEYFREHLMMQNKPAVLKGAMEFWPALGRAAGPDHAWKNLKNLRRVAGMRTIPVEVGSSYLGDDWKQELMTFNEFLDRHIILPLKNTAEKCVTGTKRGYLAQHRLFDQIPALGRDILTPDYCTLPRVRDIEEEEDITVNCWFGPRGTVSPLHFDPKDNVLCQVVGAKYVRLYAPEESGKLYPIEGMLSNTSQVQVENPDNEAFPNFVHAKYIECILREGDMLYIPPKYWHYVRSLSTSFSVSFWWS
ncbi:hypothetical protein PsorP6_016586 [Peronosclerospora sorghi]|uniref:Uncharacterized protein n=1 Tax=Peronosclerospora sorghi TaxID=230839 RepID=A0ACC0VJ69_9STRA|nr:hypothetical protein PsorP6_016586 [Peronosclerospora sorghi]